MVDTVNRILAIETSSNTRVELSKQEGVRELEDVRLKVQVSTHGDWASIGDIRLLNGGNPSGQLCHLNINVTLGDNANSNLPLIERVLKIAKALVVAKALNSGEGLESVRIVLSRETE